MKTRLVHIGNSRGVRLPKALIEQAGLEEDIDMRVADDAIILSRSGSPRQGWAEAAARLAAKAENRLIDIPTPTHFDEEEWTW